MKKNTLAKISDFLANDVEGVDEEHSVCCWQTRTKLSSNVIKKVNCAYLLLVLFLAIFDCIALIDLQFMAVILLILHVPLLVGAAFVIYFQKKIKENQQMNQEQMFRGGDFIKMSLRKWERVIFILVWPLAIASSFFSILFLIFAIDVDF